MSFSPDPLQVLLVWKMIFMNYEPSFKEMKPNLSKLRREQLKEAGLIDYDLREKQSKKRKTKSSHIILTDYAWDWAINNLDAKISDKSPQSGPVLQSVLNTLKTYMKQNNVSLYEFLHSDEGVSGANDSSDSENLELRIRTAYFQTPEGKNRFRARLSDIRDALSDIPRHVLDESLRDLKRREKILLFPFEDPQEKTPRDDEAALEESGRLNHVIIIEE